MIRGRDIITVLNHCRSALDMHVFNEQAGWCLR